jgi:hypothetical protein
MKPRSDSRLFKLNVEQQAQLYDWIHKLGYAKAKELAAQPPPAGFGFKPHLNSLCRFVARYSEMQKEREFFDILRCSTGELHPEALRAAETAAHQMAFDIATGPQQDLKKFQAIGRWIMHVKNEQLSQSWTKIEYDRLALRERLAALHAARSEPSSEKLLWAEVPSPASQHSSDVST